MSVITSKEFLIPAGVSAISLGFTVHYAHEAFSEHVNARFATQYARQADDFISDHDLGRRAINSLKQKNQSFLRDAKDCKLKCRSFQKYAIAAMVVSLVSGVIAAYVYASAPRTQ